jgi:hypothetical protein
MQLCIFYLLTVRRKGENKVFSAAFAAENTKTARVFLPADRNNNNLKSLDAL